MSGFENAEGKKILLKIVHTVQDNKDYLGEVDGKIGDGDHGMNMNKGFTLFEEKISAGETGFVEGLRELGMVLFNEIGGSMGPIYGTIFMDMAAAGEGQEEITLPVLTNMLKEGLRGLYELVDAREGDKTLVDTLSPAVKVMEVSESTGESLEKALCKMKEAAIRGKDATKDRIAKYGRASRLGERSRGVLDAGAVSCCLILCAMADGILDCLKR